MDYEKLRDETNDTSSGRICQNIFMLCMLRGIIVMAIVLGKIISENVKIAKRYRDGTL